MQEKELNYANVRIGEQSGQQRWGDRGEIYRGMRTAKRSRLWRIACSTFLGSLMMAGLFIVLVPIAGRADSDQDKDNHPGREDHDKDIRAQIAALRAQVASLPSTISALEGQVTTLQTELAAVQSNHALALGPFVSVDPNPETGVAGPIRAVASRCGVVPQQEPGLRTLQSDAPKC